MSGRGRGWAPRGRGGFHAPAFQAKKWVKPGIAPGGSAGGAAPVQPAAAAAEPAAPSLACSDDAMQPPPGATQHAAEVPSCGFPPHRSAGLGSVGARKWVKGQGASGPAPPPPPPERGRLSVFVGNLDPLVQEDHLWRFFGQAGRVSRWAILSCRCDAVLILFFAAAERALAVY